MTKYNILLDKLYKQGIKNEKELSTYVIIKDLAERFID
jgi:hypothetical protein